jgi:hypothetical protein
MAEFVRRSNNGREEKLMRCRSEKRFVMFVVFVALLTASPGISTTIKHLDFGEVVQQAGIVVEGTVVDLRVQSTGSDIRTGKTKNHAAPMSQSSRLKHVHGETLAEGGATAPQSVGVEGGKMLFTEVTMLVETEIVGSPGSTIRFRVAGGSNEHCTVIVFGMPSFELGKKYVVFLQPDLETTNTPIIGVNQGYFEVVRSDEGNREILLNADGDIVVGIERSQVLLRHNPQKSAGRMRHLAAAPVPATGSEVQAKLSPEVQRYWSSTESPMSRDSFFAAVRAAKGGTP